MSQWEGGPEQHLHHSSGLLLYSRSPLCLPLREHTEERRRVDSHSLRSHYDASGGWALLWIWRPFVCVAAEAGIHLSHCLTGGDAEGAAKLRADLVVGRSSLAQVCLAENVGTKKKKKKKGWSSGAGGGVCASLPPPPRPPPPHCPLLIDGTAESQCGMKTNPHILTAPTAEIEKPDEHDGWW